MDVSTFDNQTRNVTTFNNKCVNFEVAKFFTSLDLKVPDVYSKVAFLTLFEERVENNVLYQLYSWLRNSRIQVKKILYNMSEFII